MTPYRFPFALFIALASALFFSCRAAPAFAAIVIDRVETGTPSADDEIITLINTGDIAHDISSWSLQVKNAGSNTIQKKNFTVGSTIAPQGTFIIAHKNGAFAPQANMTYASLSLSGSGGTLALVSSQSYVTSFDHSSVVSSVYFGTPTSTAQDTQKTPPEKPPPETKAVSAAPEFIGDAQQPRPQVWPIIINELFPNPTGAQEEFIELANTSGEGLDISGLWLRDASGAAYALGSRGENTLLGAYETRAWPRTTTRIALNDTDGEALFLIDSNGSIVDRIIYTNDALESAAYARFKKAWLWTQTPTPSQTNSLQRLQVAPVARAVIPKSTLATHEKISVSATDSTDENDSIISYIWDFGDGIHATGVTSTHTYAASGTFVLSLTVTDSFGATSTVSKTMRVLSGGEKISASVAALAVPPATSAPASTHHVYRGTISVPLGILGKRRFVVNGRTVEITSDRQILTRLTRGTIVQFTARELFRSDRLILQITARDSLRIISTGDAPLPDALSGEIISTSKTGFILAASSTDYAVLAGSKYSSRETIAVGDRVSLHGVLLRDDAPHPIFVVSRPDDIMLISRAQNKQQSPTHNVGLLAGSAVILLGVHFALQHVSWRALATKIKNTLNRRSRGDDSGH